MNIQALMKQAQKLQSDMAKKKEELNLLEFTGSASLVKVTVNGKKEILKVEIDRDSNLEKEDIELLEEMVMLAVNDALSKVTVAANEKLGSLPGGMTDLM